MEGKPRVALMNCPHCGYAHMSNTACPQCGTVAGEEEPAAAAAGRTDAAPRARGESPVRAADAGPAYSVSGSTVLEGDTLKRMCLVVVTVLGCGLCLYVSIRWDTLWGQRDYGYRRHDFDDVRPSRSYDNQKINTQFIFPPMENK